MMVMAVVVVVVIDLTVKSDCAIVHCSCGCNECNVESWLVYCGSWCEHTIHLKSTKRAGRLGGIIFRILQDRLYGLLVHGLFVVVMMAVAMQMVVLGSSILVMVTTMQLLFVL